jgi:hypothetical protein
MANKPTKKEQFEKILTYVANDAELVKFINHEIELVTKKNASKSAKQTERQAENANLMDVIYEGMQADKQYTVSDLISEIPALNGMNTQRVAPMLKKMRENVLVSRSESGGKAYFTKI